VTKMWKRGENNVMIIFRLCFENERANIIGSATATNGRRRWTWTRYC